MSEQRRRDRQDYSNVGNPTVTDLLPYSPVAGPERIIRRYFIQKDPDKSVRRHERLLVAPLMRKVVLNTVGRIRKGDRRDRQKPPIDEAAKLAFSKTVNAEMAHSTAAVVGLNLIAEALVTGAVHDLSSALYLLGYSVITGYELSLVALNRYARARMLRLINQELAKGENFDSNYRNWTEIDAGSVLVFKYEQEERNRRRK